MDTTAAVLWVKDEQHGPFRAKLHMGADAVHGYSVVCIVRDFLSFGILLQVCNAACHSSLCESLVATPWHLERFLLASPKVRCL